MAKKVAGWLGGALLVLLLYLFLWPVPIDPIFWEPPAMPALEGDFAENRVLQGMELFATPNGHGPEDVALDAEGRIYVGVEEGQIIRYAADGSDPQVFADTGGRPLGLDFDNDGNLIVADAVKGLLSIDQDGAIDVLCTEADSKPFGFTDDVDVDSQNVAWFSDASVRWDHHHFMNDAFENRPSGRLLKYDSSTGACSVVLDGLFFANGVAVSPDDSYVLVNETMRYRTKRVYVRGPRTGEVEVFIDNLPGFPDGISTGADGRFLAGAVCAAQRIARLRGTKALVAQADLSNPRGATTEAEASSLRFGTRCQRQGRPQPSGRGRRGVFKVHERRAGWRLALHRQPDRAQVGANQPQLASLRPAKRPLARGRE